MIYYCSRRKFTSSKPDTIVGIKLGEYGAMLLGKALESPNCKLTILNLTGMMLCRLRLHFHVSVLCPMLCVYQLILVLFSSPNQTEHDIESEGACAIAKPLRSPNCRLEKLDLSGSRRFQRRCINLPSIPSPHHPTVDRFQAIKSATRERASSQHLSVRPSVASPP